jgi:hypothetical protein
MRPRLVAGAFVVVTIALVGGWMWWTVARIDLRRLDEPAVVYAAARVLEPGVSVTMFRSGMCRKYVPRPLVTGWAVTWLQYVESISERKPILYSYPQFLESAMVRDERLNGFPLWLAQYALDLSIIVNRKPEITA